MSAMYPALAPSSRGAAWALQQRGAGGVLHGVGCGVAGLGWVGLAGLGWAGLGGLGWAGLSGLGWAAAPDTQRWTDGNVNSA